MVILVPAYPWLFNRFDVELGHHRRYTKQTLATVFSNTGLTITTSYYFNLAGIAGWWLSGQLQKNKIIPAGQMRLFNSFVPLFKIADALSFRRMGLSLVMVGKKKKILMRPPLLSIVVPVYNEASTICVILDRVKNVILIRDIEKEIIVVNDCSTDDTEKVVKEYKAANPTLCLHYLKHPVNAGKGAALRTGIKHSTGDFIIMQDADLEYDPEEYNMLLKPILSGVADVVYGSRFTNGNARRVLFFWHTIGNKFLTFISNLFCNLNLSDMETCYKLFRADVIKSIQLKENCFGFEPEVTAKIARIPGIRIYEVGISYAHISGRKKDWLAGWRQSNLLYREIQSLRILIVMAHHISNHFPSHEFTNESKNLFTAKVIIGVGILLRTVQLLQNEGLREDEGNLAINYLTRDFFEILGPLDYGQIAPHLFLLIEKMLLTWFGENEFSLRIVPFLSSCLALVIAYKFFKRKVNGFITTAVMACLAINRNMIFSAVAAKQYSVDVLVFITMSFLVFTPQKGSRIKNTTIIGIAGTICPWLSHPSLFVLAMISLFWLARWRQTAFEEKSAIAASVLAWGVSICILLLVTKNHENKGVMVSYWEDHFMPQKLDSTFIKWHTDHFQQFIAYAFGFSVKHWPLSATYGILFFIGLRGCWMSRENRHLLWLLLPAVIHVIVSSFKLYPFQGRLLLYLCFPMFITIVVGIDYVLRKLSAFHPAPRLRVLALVIFVSLLSLVALVNFPYTTEDIKKPLAFAGSRFVEGETIYVYYAVRGGFDFYKRNYFPPGTKIVYGHPSRQIYTGYDKQIRNLSGRVWFIFSHIYTNPAGEPEDAYIVGVALKRGKLVVSDTFKHASVYLVDFGAEPENPTSSSTDTF